MTTTAVNSLELVNSKSQNNSRSPEINLFDLSVLELHNEALRATKVLQTSESYLLKVLEAVDERKLYFDCELNSLYQYCVQLLQLSESVSASYVSVINKSKEVPELKQAVISGKVSLSKAKKICSVITPKNHQDWIGLAIHETSRVIEKCVAKANPKELTKESLTYKTEDRLELKLGVSEEWVEILKTVKDLLAQKNNKHVDSESALHAVMLEYVERHHPVKKAERAKARQEKERQVPGTIFSASRQSKAQKRVRATIKRKTIHEVNLKDQNQCTHVSWRGRCEEKRWLDVHHKIPLALGGSDDPENLVTLCRAHHYREHKARICGFVHLLRKRGHSFNRVPFS